MKDLSIIIVNYNVCEYLVNCINSIYKNISGISFEIIVVDNHSLDGSIEAIKNKFPGVCLIENTDNVGFSKANNQAISVAKGNYIFLLNPDTLLLDNSILKMLTYFKKYKQNCLIAPKILNADYSLQYSAWMDKNLKVIFQEALRIFISKYSVIGIKNPFLVENVFGSAMLFSKELISSVGNLDENLFFMDDFDFCYRVRKNGGSVIYFPDCSIIHYGGKSSGNDLKLFYANDNISKLKFYKKHFSLLKYFLSSILILFHILAYSFWLLFSSWRSANHRRQLKAYLFTARAFFQYLFSGDDSLIFTR